MQITPAIVAEHGLKPDEYQRIIRHIGREPNLVELGIFSVMWSEHCSYKSSRRHLRKLPTKAPWVIKGPGENAGVVDIGDGMAAIFKMESHNHPSFIEPYQGAATGVGGILRDVFTMGARPIANLNALRFGAPDHPKTRHLVSGVVAGIGGYGNCVGVPTVAGECSFHPAYNGNILVNAMTVGIARADRIFYAAAAGIGNPVVYVGSKTGRDGIHGATMASAEFGDDSDEKRPTVQVGDPFTEKLLIEACLEIMAEDAVVAIQDMGAAGLTSSSCEMASKGGVGIELDLDKVPCRETGMTAYEIMLSESQERMLMVLRQGREHIADRIFKKWGLDVAVIGRITDTGRVVIKKDGRIEADMPVGPLADDAPQYDRPYVPTPPRKTLSARDVPAADIKDALLRLLGSPDLASKRWIWEQYDHLVRGDTVQRPGGDAAVVRIEGSKKGLAATSDCTPRYCFADPFSGGVQAVAEAYRNLSAVGARPLAITDCLNFGSPERPEIMGQFVGCIEGMALACATLNFPVVSGNVSLYNETNGQAVLPTPQIGAIGLLDDIDRMATAALKTEGDVLFLIGKTKGELGASLYLREICGREDGAPPEYDLAAERRNGEFVRRLIASGRVKTCHDVSDGGLLVALAEMALAGGIGAKIDPIWDSSMPAMPPQAFLFGEDQARYVVAVSSKDAKKIEAEAPEGVVLARLGRVGGHGLTLAGFGTISLADMRARHEGWMPALMEKG